MSHSILNQIGNTPIVEIRRLNPNPQVRVLAKPLGAPPAHYDMAKEGVADITYGLHSFTKDDRFLRSRIGQFSFLGDDAVAAPAPAGF